MDDSFRRDIGVGQGERFEPLVPLEKSKAHIPYSGAIEVEFFQLGQARKVNKSCAGYSRIVEVDPLETCEL